MGSLTSVVNKKPRASRHRRAGNRIVLGHDVLDATLAEFNVTTANRIARSGLGKAVRVIAKGVKSQVPSSLKDVRAAIGYRVGSGKGKGRSSGVTQAKVGAAVGKPRKRAVRDRTGRPGVGISRTNIHWWVMGATGAKPKKGAPGPPRRTKTGKSTGVTTPNPVVKQGYSASSSAATTALRDGVLEGIQRELTKKHKKK